MSVFDDLLTFSPSSTRQPSAPTKPTDKLVADLTDLGYDLQEILPLLHHQGNALVISCAGSGKTTALTQKIIYDIVSGSSTYVKQVNNVPVRLLKPIFVSTFLKSGARELQQSIDNMSTKLGVPSYSKNMVISTLHSEFYQVLRNLGLVEREINESKAHSILAKELRSYNLGYNGKLSKEEVYTIQGALTKARNILGPERYNSSTLVEYKLTPKLVDAILESTYRQRIAQGVMDFEDIQDILYAHLSQGTPQVVEYVSTRYRVMYLDEVQDISEIQYEILKHYFKGTDQVIAVGDDDQVIYTWRGSDKTIITERFLPDTGSTLFHLSTNYRCPSNVLKSILPSINRNRERFPKEMTSSQEGGLVRVGSFNSYIEMGEELAQLIQDDVRNRRSAMVLVRVNSDGLIPAILLDKTPGIKFSISSEGMSFRSSQGRAAMAVADLFNTIESKDTTQLLNTITKNRREVTTLVKHCKENRTSFWRLDPQDLVYSCGTLGTVLSRWVQYRQDPSHTDMDTLRYMLDDLQFRVFLGTSNYILVLKAALEAVHEFSVGFDSVESLILGLDELNYSLQSKVHTKSSVTIQTVHEAKGKEADSVYIWNDSTNVFPHVIRGKVSDPEEERRIHYIAATRSRQLLTILHKAEAPSPYLKEMDLTSVESLNQFAGVL